MNHSILYHNLSIIINHLEIMAGDSSVIIEPINVVDS